MVDSFEVMDVRDTTATEFSVEERVRHNLISVSVPSLQKFLRRATAKIMQIFEP